MRILTVGNGYPPHHHGGYELIWQSSVEQLRDGGHEVAVLTTDTRTGAGEADPPGVVRELRWRLKNGRFEPLGIRDRARMTRHNHALLDRVLGEFKPDVVGWWAMGGLSLTMLRTAHERGIPSVAFVLDEWLDYGQWADAWLGTFTGPRRGRLAPVAERVTGLPAAVDLGTVTRYVFISEFTRQQALNRGLELRDTGVEHSGIHVDFLDPAPPVADWEWKLLYVGRIDHRKGIDTAIEALEHLPPGASLTIAGSWDPGEEKRLQGMAAERGLAERVVFSGKLERAALVAAYGAADVVVFPVRWNEPWGLVPIEAMARGRPVVATGRGGSGEYLRDGENCMLFDADDPRGLARAVERLAADEQLRGCLRERGLETASQYTEPAYNAAVERELRAAVTRGRLE